MTDIASLGLKVDSSQVVSAKEDLEGFSEAADRAESSAESLGETLGEAKKGATGFAEGVRETRDAAGGMSETAAAAGRSAIILAAGLAAAAVTVGVLVKAYITGAHEAETYARAIAETGNAAGLTTGQLGVMASRIDAVVGTQAKAAETLAIFAATGKIGADNLERFATVAIQAERSIGTPLKDTAKAFAELADEPTKAAAKLQKTFNFLTPAVYDYIRAQEKLGNVSEASAAAQSSYAAAVERQSALVEGELNVLGKAWRFVADEAKEAWDAMLDVGRGSSVEEKLKELQELREGERRQLGQQTLGANANVAGNPRQAANDVEERRLIAVVAQRKKEADALAEIKKLTDAYIQSQEDSAKAADDFAEAQKRINQAWAASDLSKLETDLRQIVAKYENAGDELEALRASNLVTDEKYFATRRRLLQASVDAEIRELRAANAILSKEDGLSSVERIQNQAKVAQNTARIAELRIRTSGQLRVLDIQEHHALEETARAYEEAKLSADRYVETLIKRFRIESEGLGLGTRERERLRERQSIEENFEQRRQKLERDRARGDITAPQLKERLEIERKALEQSLAAYDQYYDELAKKQGDWRTGALEAIHNFIDEAQDAASQFEGVFSRAFEGAADALTNFAMTGKLDFKGFINSILADLLRVEAKIALSNILKSVLGSFQTNSQAFDPRAGQTKGIEFPSGGARANGGPVSPGMSYLVGERGPEMFTPSSPGRITANEKMGGGISINNTNYFSSGLSPAQIEASLNARDANILNQVYQGQRRGRAGA